jgi:hypothetical protein
MPALAIVATILNMGCNESNKPSTLIRGTVVTESGKAMPRVPVILDGTSFQTVTNKSGRFALSGFPEGIYTVVAVKPGYLAATHYNIEITKEDRKKETVLTLKPDPAYVPDSVKIINISPMPETVLPPGRDVGIRFQVKYVLSSDEYATIAVSYQDERGTGLMPMPSHVTVTARQGQANFGQTIRVPARANGKLQVIAALFPGATKETSAVDIVTYYIRPFSDQVKVTGFKLTADSEWAQGRDVAATVSVTYLIKSFERGIVRMQIRGDLGNQRFEVILHEASQTVTKASGGTGSLTFPTKFSIPHNVTAVKARADLVPEDVKEPLVIHWSQSYRLDQPPGRG